MLKFTPGRVWVYKCRGCDSDSVNQRACGDWETDLFEPYRRMRSKRPIEWGGTWATGDRRSQEIFRHEMGRDDLVIAWQTDRSAAVGLARVAQMLHKVSGDVEVMLEPLERWSSPVRFHVLKRTSHPHLSQVSALRQGPVATVYATTRQEAFWLLDAAGSAWAQSFGP